MKIYSNKYIQSIIALTFFIALSGQVYAQNNTQRKGQSAINNSMNQIQKNMDTVTGQIEKIKQVTIRGTEQKFEVVLLRLPDGNRMVVDLGPVEQYKEMSITTGKQLFVRGQISRVGDRPVLFANQAIYKNITINITRPRLSTEAAMTAQPPITISEKRIIGQIMREKDVSILGTNKKDKVVLLKTQRGRQIVVDLGYTENLKNLSLETGQTINVKGKPARIGDRLVFLADWVKSNGKTARTNHPPLQETGKQAPSEMKQKTQ